MLLLDSLICSKFIVDYTPKEYLISIWMGIIDILGLA